MQYTLAIDIGASSGRHILGWQENGQWQMEEVYRFPNSFKQQNGHDCWDVDALLHHVLEGMKQCRSAGKIPATAAIDTWGVDYVLLDAQGKRVGDTVAYRDSRTDGIDVQFEQTMPFSELYARAGIAKQPFNTLYQLLAEFHEHPAYREQAKSLVFMPCYLTGLLCGVMRNEYTIASTSALLNARTRDWDRETLAAAGIPLSLMGEKPAQPGTVLGHLLPEIAQQVGYDCKILLTACHDTGSAFYAVPTKDPSAVYISSGTWSLLGTLLPEPVLTQEALRSNFTNEGGIGGIRFLKNIMGLWMLQRIRAEWNNRLSFAEMAELAQSGASYQPIVEVTRQCFLNPPCMSEAIRSELQRLGEPLPRNDAELLYCVNHSLAAGYARAIENLQEITGRLYTSVNIMGGGCNNRLLNRLTEEATGLPVRVGPTEATALGNLMAQHIAR